MSIKIDYALYKDKNLMMKSIFVNIIFFSVFLSLNSCVKKYDPGAPNSPFVTSKDLKLDFKKRYQPIYNQKYIDIAKKNIKKNQNEKYQKYNNLDDYEDDEEYYPQKINQENYHKANLAEDQISAQKIIEDRARYKERISRKPIDSTAKNSCESQIKEMEEKVNVLEQKLNETKLGYSNRQPSNKKETSFHSTEEKVNKDTYSKVHISNTQNKNHYPAESDRETKKNIYTQNKNHYPAESDRETKSQRDNNNSLEAKNHNDLQKNKQNNRFNKNFNTDTKSKNEYKIAKESLDHPGNNSNINLDATSQANQEHMKPKNQSTNNAINNKEKIKYLNKIKKNSKKNK